MVYVVLQPAFLLQPLLLILLLLLLLRNPTPSPPRCLLNSPHPDLICFPPSFSMPPSNSYCSRTPMLSSPPRCQTPSSPPTPSPCFPLPPHVTLHKTLLLLLRNPNRYETLILIRSVFKLQRRGRRRPAGSSFRPASVWRL